MAMLRYKLISFDSDGKKRDLRGCLEGLKGLPVFNFADEAEIWKDRIEKVLGYDVELIQFTGEDTSFESIIDESLAYADHSNAIEGLILDEEEKALVKRRMMREITEEEFVDEVMRRIEKG